jgi:hypothetical protein
MMGDDEIEPWDDFNEVDLSKKRYVSDETRAKMSSSHLGKPSTHKLSQDTVIAQFREVHGDRYDYSKVDYQGARTKVIIICQEHGEFLQIPSSHKRGAICPRCYAPRLGLSNQEIIKGFKEKHGDRYDYSKVEHVNNKTKIIIICKEHGEFLQSSKKHWNGHGCPKCGWIITGKQNKKNKKPQEEIIKRFREVHGYRFFYNKVNYRGYDKTVRIICRKQGHGGFRVTPQKHKSRVTGGCPRCRKERSK